MDGEVKPCRGPRGLIAPSTTQYAELDLERRRCSRGKRGVSGRVDGPKGNLSVIPAALSRSRGAVTRRAVAKRRSRASGLTRPLAEAIQGIRQIGAILHAKAVSATVVKPFGFATGDGEGSRCGIRTRIALQNPVAQVVVAIPWGHGPFAIPGQGRMLIGYARVSTQETREQSPEKRRRTPLTTFWAAEMQLGEPPHCVRSRLRRIQVPQRSSETPR